jgi:hypothetical protein
MVIIITILPIIVIPPLPLLEGRLEAHAREDPRRGAAHSIREIYTPGYVGESGPLDNDLL